MFICSLETHTGDIGGDPDEEPVATDLQRTLSPINPYSALMRGRGYVHDAESLYVLCSHCVHECLLRGSDGPHRSNGHSGYRPGGWAGR
jgi:hypothetical protein